MRCDCRGAAIAVIGWPVLAMALLASPEVAAQARPLQASAAEVIGAAHEFTSFGEAALGPRGLLAVTQPRDATVLLFDLARPARPVATLGRRGDGPGEFRTPGHLGWRGDTLWVSDRGRPRIEFFAAPRWSVSSRSVVPPALRGPGWRFVAPIGYLRDSTLLHFPSRFPGQGPFTPTTMPVLLTPPNGLVSDTIAILHPQDDLFCVTGDRSGGAAGSCSAQPIVSQDFVRVGRAGEWVLLLLQSGGPGAAVRPEVRVVRHDGTPVYRTPLELQPRRVANHQWDSIVTVWSKSFAQDVWTTPARAREGLSAVLRRPESYPVVDQALLGADGVAWIRASGEGGGKRRWQLIGPTGTPFGWVMLDADLRLLDASATEAIAVRMDRDGVPTLLRIQVGR